MIFNLRLYHLVCFVLLIISNKVISQQIESKYYDCLKWRNIGPHRGGRTVGATGVVQQPNVFYIGVNNGGVWKTTDYGRTWNPIFDEQYSGSIGDVMVAPSNPEVVYVASGEGIQRPDLSVGNGMYKSTDAGKTWSHLGLEDGQQIGGIAIDPGNENVVFAAVLGHPYGPNSQRGVYRTQDGGKTWKQVLYLDENTGAIQVCIDPNNPKIVFADMFASRQAPWENGVWHGPGSGLYKSTDGGDTWKKCTNGLPTFEQGLGRIGFCIAPSKSGRMYATVDAGEKGGLYRSVDGGESWTLINSDGRLWGRGDDFAECKADPKNPDIVYVANVVTWKSTDGGKTFSGFRGAPGGDDSHRLWINPQNPEIILLAGDQGAIITVNGGESWSSWYNQPTAQFYHVSTDNAFPYHVYGGQQESGSVDISSRGNDGSITFRDWHPVGVEEYGYIAPDPLDPNIIYGGKITRYDKKTGQVQNISPEVVRSGKYRFLRTAPVLFSPIDPHTLYFAGNVLFKTRNGGHSWQIISPDLTRTQWEIPACIGVYQTPELNKMARRGVIYAVAPSPLDINTIWAGTDDGLIHVTRDGGKNWKNVTPPEISSWSKISMIEASHTDLNTAYVAVNRIRLDDMHPHIFKTTNGGNSWKEITIGLPDDPINTVKEDPKTKGLLFAGSERAVYFSPDDGNQWYPLRLNMPATSIRDLVIKDDDIVVGTHGRSFWILDNIMPIRHLARQKNTGNVLLYPASATYRVRWNLNTDTPIPQEEAAGQNPPEGAYIDYYLHENAKGEVILNILDQKGEIIRHYSNKDIPYATGVLNIPTYWIRPQQILSGSAGSHRFMWDLHYQPLNVPPSYPIAAIYQNTAPEYTSPWVLPGKYTIQLMVDGVKYSQSIQVKMDPRVKTKFSDLKLQHDLSFKSYRSLKRLFEIKSSYEHLKEEVKNLDNSQDKEGVIAAFEIRLNDLTKANSNASSHSVSGYVFEFDRLIRDLSGVFNTLQEADYPPTIQTIAGAKEAQHRMDLLIHHWDLWLSNDVKNLNTALIKMGQKPIEMK